MATDITQEILDELIPTFEAIEAKSAAVLQLVKEKRIATDDELARYLETANAAASVRWRAVRVRMERLFSSAMENLQKTAEDTTRKQADQESNEIVGPPAEAKPKPVQRVETSDSDDSKEHPDQKAVANRNNPAVPKR